MSGRYKKYPEYKDSGVGLLGDIPSHWAVDKFRYLFSLGRGLGITKANLQESGIPCVNYGEIHSKYGFEVSPNTHPLKCVSELYLESSPKSLLSNGDCIFADTSEDIEGAGNFTQLISDQDLFAGYHTIIARPEGGNDARFLAYVLDSPVYRTQIRLAVKGVKVFSITQEILKNTDLWLAPLPEQKQIAKFLDHETGKIDRLISKQQELIALLKEKRQAVISHAVTKGLNPHAPMKDSGVEWLGEVPEHWEVAKLKYFAAIQGGYAFSSEQFCEEGVQLLRIGNVYLNQLALERQPVFLRRELLKAHSDFIVEQNDILMSLTGTLGKTDYGYAVKVEEAGPFLLNQRVGKISPLEREISHDYLLYSVRSNSYMKQLYSLPSGTKQANLSNSDVLNISIAVPAIKSEQDHIGSYIAEKTTALDSLIVKSENAIDLMQERRTALISAAVTGKVDVRSWKLEG